MEQDEKRVSKGWVTTGGKGRRDSLAQTMEESRRGKERWAQGKAVEQNEVELPGE